MVGVLPLLAMRSFYGMTLKMPQPITAMCLGTMVMNAWTPVVAGDEQGNLYEPLPRNPPIPNPIGSVPGRVLNLHFDGHGSFTVVYAPSTGEERVERWEMQGEGFVKTEIQTLPRGARPLVSRGEGAVAVGVAGGNRVDLYLGQGKKSTIDNLPSGLVGLAMSGSEQPLIAAFASGDLIAYGVDGKIRWHRTVPTRGHLLSFQGGIDTDSAAWASDASGGQVGVIDLSTGKWKGEPRPAPGVVRVVPMVSNLPLVIGERSVWAVRHAEPTIYGTTVLAADTSLESVAVSLADGTLSVRLMLRPWMRKGEAGLVAP